MKPRTPEELSDICRQQGPFRLVCSDSRAHLRHSSPDAVRIELSDLSGVVEYEPDDQVVVVRAGMALDALQSELAARCQRLPLGESSLRGTVGGALSARQPEAWRDWVLGMTVVLADGTVARCGSKAVKNVAGYDVQKLFIGAWGTLGVVAEVVLRTYPLGVADSPAGIAARGPAAAAIDPTATRFMMRAKSIFDPESKFNPGEFGFL